MMAHVLKTLAVTAGLLIAGAAFAQTADPATPPPPAPPAAGPVAPVAAEWRTVAAEDLLVVDTTKGRVFVELAPRIAPLHVERIRLLAHAGFYDNLVCTASSTASWPRPATRSAPATARAPIPT